jgi:hypothetical protein
MTSSISLTNAFIAEVHRISSPSKNEKKAKKITKIAAGPIRLAMSLRLI